MGIIMLTTNNTNTANDVKSISLLEMYNSPLGCCMVPANDGFRLLREAGADVLDPGQYIGDGELFRAPHMGHVIVGERGTIVSATPMALGKDAPTVVSKQINGDGYRVISDHYGCESYRVCRLVASLWVPGYNPAAGADEVDHLDGDRANDNADNLEWVTHAENIRRSYQRGTRRARRKWTPDDIVLLLPRYPGAGRTLITEARNVSRITGSTNVSHCLTYGDRCGCGDYYVVPVPVDLVTYLRTPIAARTSCMDTYNAMMDRVNHIGKDPRTDHAQLCEDVDYIFGAFWIRTLDDLRADPTWYHAADKGVA